MNKLDNLHLWKIFVSLAQSRNFSYTAADLDVEVSTVSRSIETLEKLLGQKLFTRKSRPIELTDTGRKALELIHPLLDKHSEIVETLCSQNFLLEGKIRLSTSQGIVTEMLMPIILEFNELYPKVVFEINGSGNTDDVVSHRADIACVTGRPKNPELIALARGRNCYVPVASAQYIQKFGMINHPDELAKHRVLLFNGGTRSASEWLYSANEKRPIVGAQILRMSNILAIKNYVLHNYGVCVDLPLFLCAEEIINHNLIPILKGWFLPPKPTFVVSTKSTWNSRIHRLFMEFFKEKSRAYFERKELMTKPFWSAPTSWFGQES